MNSEGLTVLKVFVLSLVLAIAIKTLGPLWPLPLTPAIALTLVLLPPLIMAALLGWHYRRQLR